MTAGGRWTDRLSPLARRNLRCFWFSGLVAQASESIVVTYLTLYLLALGASAGQIGLTSSLSNLSAALLVLPGAIIVERWGRRKQIVVWSGGVPGRAMLALLALVPAVLIGPPALYLAIALAVIRTALANLAVPAWTSLTADVVPLEWRGRYFSSRNMAMGIAGMAVTFVVGQLITGMGGLAGYQLAMGVAFFFGMTSTFFYSRIKEPTAWKRLRVGTSPRLPLLKNVLARPEFLLFCAVAAVWNFSLNLAGPFYSVHFVTGLNGSPGFWGVISVVHGLAALPGQRLFGVLSDRWGPRQVQLVTGLLIPFVPWLWSLSRAPWQLVPIELVSGFLWAGYGLSSFNFLLTLTPEDRRARYAALHQIVVTVALSAGAALGGTIATWWGYKITFVLSGVGRLAAALIFAFVVRPLPSGEA